jgi:hypothetical protein
MRKDRQVSALRTGIIDKRVGIFWHEEHISFGLEVNRFTFAIRRTIMFQFSLTLSVSKNTYLALGLAIRVQALTIRLLHATISYKTHL